MEITPSIYKIINSGFLQVRGRDRNFRPLIIMRPNIAASITPRPDISEGLMACAFMLEYVKSQFFLPGQIENWIIVFDLSNLSLMNVPFKTLKAFLDCLQSQYRCTAAKIFVLNVSSAFAFLWNTIKGFLEEHTKKKLQITK